MEVSISVYLYIYTYVCTVLVVYGTYIQYIVFIRTLSFPFTLALLLTNRSAVSVCPRIAAYIRAVIPPYIYKYTYKNVRYRHSKRGKHTQHIIHNHKY